MENLKRKRKNDRSLVKHIAHPRSFPVESGDLAGPTHRNCYMRGKVLKGGDDGDRFRSLCDDLEEELVAYGQRSVLTISDSFIGLALGPVMIAGSFLGKRVVDRLPERVFVPIIEAVLMIAGLVFALNPRIKSQSHP
ncbi:MAG: hypothetical protein ACP5M4_07275 [Acidobacteriaceae bacterium]